MVKNGELSSKQKKAIASLLLSKNIGDRCEAVGIGRTTLSRWMQNANFRNALYEAEKEILDETLRILLGGHRIALLTLSYLIENAQSESVRRAASCDWLDFSMKFYEITKLENRIVELEKAVYKK